MFATRRHPLLIFTFVLGIVASGTFASSARAAEIYKILILHSYHQGLAWTDQVNAGIQSVFSPLDKQFELHFEYLDAKRQALTRANAASRTAFYRKLTRTVFDLVIVSDDEAFDWLGKIGRSMAWRPPVVFCGVTPLVPENSTFPFPLTGVFKTTDHTANLRLMVKLHPRCKRIIFLFDWKPNADASLQALNDIIATVPDQITIDVWPDQSLDRLPAKLQSLESSDLIYMLAVNRDKNKNYLYSDEAVRLVTRWSPAPVYSPVEAYLGKGIVGGKITSGFRQGETAAQLALRIISGESATSIPMVTTSPNPYMFDYRQLNKLNLSIAQLPAGSIIINQPPPFWIRWSKTLIVVTLVALSIVLALSAGILLLQRNHRNLKTDKSQLDNRLKEKTVHLKLLNQKLKKQSLSDALTGLANRRHILQRFAEEVKRAQRYETALTIALFDLDRFKSINAEFGYIVGDQIIRDVARAIKRCIREIDLVGRFSGEAFLIILPNTDIAMAYHSAQRILTAVAALQWENGQIQVTLSCGLAQLAGQTLPELTTLAENLQQQAKNNGGNQISAHL